MEKEIRRNKKIFGLKTSIQKPYSLNSLRYRPLGFLNLGFFPIFI